MTEPEYRRKVGKDPYRYTCPECDSHQVYYNLRNAGKGRYSPSKRPKKDYTFDSRGASEARTDRSKKYRCEGCGSWLEKVWDKKEEYLAEPT